jgi:hypothetical protein
MFTAFHSLQLAHGAEKSSIVRMSTKPTVPEHGEQVLSFTITYRHVNVRAWRGNGIALERVKGSLDVLPTS